MKTVLTWDQRFAEINAMRQRFAVVMSDLIREKDNVALVLADITAERFSDVLRDFPDRVINTGIREPRIQIISATLGHDCGECRRKG